MRDANKSLVITCPGFLAIKLVHALEKLELKNLKTPTSRGCNIWVV